jgi:GTP1/Obg family GTP-binding protein
VRAAIVYFTKHRCQYSLDEQKSIWKRIIRAAKKFGIEVSEKVKERED